jgi:mono/diheme cytochrome c family protein
MGAQAADIEAGRRVFAEKQCARCHVPRGEPGLGPALEEIRRPQGEMELAGRLWNHLPGMLVSIPGQNLTWPVISVGEMGDLMAYLQAEAVRDPEPDLARGRMTLLRKGCLKCHTLRREGGPVKPDLAEQRADYGSGPAWAATMWQHTPRMEAMARRQGVLYPRFAADEMANLVGLLRSVAGP